MPSKFSSSRVGGVTALLSGFSLKVRGHSRDNSGGEEFSATHAGTDVRKSHFSFCSSL